MLCEGEDTIYNFTPVPLLWETVFNLRFSTTKSSDGTYFYSIWLATHVKDMHLLPINTMMNKTQICEMLSVMSDMTKAACEGVNFVEVSTYVKNHCPGIEPEFVEVFRDMIYPIVRAHKNL